MLLDEIYSTIDLIERLTFVKYFYVSYFLIFTLLFISRLYKVVCVVIKYRITNKVHKYTED